MNFTDIIKNAVTSDGRCGYDEFGQFRVIVDDHGSNGYRVYIQEDVRGKTCLLCGEAWESTTRSIVDQHYDSASACTVHSSCMDRHIAYLQRSAWLEDLIKAGIRNVSELANRGDAPLHFETVPNEYSPANGLPWYRVTLSTAGRPVLTIGRRKHVDSMTITRLTCAQAGAIAQSLAREAVTQDARHDSFSIHANTREDRVRYLAVMFKVVAQATDGATVSEKMCEAL